MQQVCEVAAPDTEGIQPEVIHVQHVPEKHKEASS